MTPYRCLIFDLDGTVVDSHAYTFAAFRAACWPYRHVSDAEIYAAFGPDERVILARLVGDARTRAACERLHAYYVTHVHDLQLDPRIGALLETCRKAGLACGLFTGRGLQSTRLILEALDLNDYFDAVAAGDTVSRPKPAADGVLQLLRVLEVRPAQTLVVGDSALDVQAAQAAGTDAILVDWFASEVTRAQVDGPRISHPEALYERVGLRRPRVEDDAP